MASLDLTLIATKRAHVVDQKQALTDKQATLGGVGGSVGASYQAQIDFQQLRIDELDYLSSHTAAQAEARLMGYLAAIGQAAVDMQNATSLSSADFTTKSLAELCQLGLGLHPALGRARVGVLLAERARIAQVVIANGYKVTLTPEGLRIGQTVAATRT